MRAVRPCASEHGDASARRARCARRRRWRAARARARWPPDRGAARSTDRRARAGSPAPARSAARRAPRGSGSRPAGRRPAGRRRPLASAHSMRTGRRLPSMPCRKGSGNEPTTAGRARAGRRVSAQTRSPPWTLVSSAAATPLTQRPPLGCPRRTRAHRRAGLDLDLAHGDGPEVAGDGGGGGSLVAGLAHAAAGQQERGAEEAASCVRQRGRNATGRYIRLVTVNLTRIYTRLGDGGETHLGDMSRVPKTHPRIEAYGAIDELNALVGLALTAEGLPRALCGVAAPRAERPLRPRRRPERARGRRAQAPARRARAGDVARAGVRRGQRDARAAEVVRPARRLGGRRPPARLPHRVPARRAPRAGRARTPTPRSCATSTASPTCSSSSAAGPTRATSRCGSRGGFARRHGPPALDCVRVGLGPSRDLSVQAALMSGSSR